jgi:hypothetical protein
MDKKITIHKLGEEKQPEPKKKKTLKTFPKGILKSKSKFTLKGVVDPAKSPALKKGMKRHTLRLLTERGMKKYRKTLKNRIAGMTDAKVLEVVQGKGLVMNPKTPPGVSRQILEHAASAGFVSVPKI